MKNSFDKRAQNIVSNLGVSLVTAQASILLSTLTGFSINKFLGRFQNVSDPAIKKLVSMAFDQNRRIETRTFAHEIRLQQFWS